MFTSYKGIIVNATAVRSSGALSILNQLSAIYPLQTGINTTSL